MMCLLELWVYLWVLGDLFLRWVMQYRLEYPIQLSPESLVQPLDNIDLCLKEI